MIGYLHPTPLPRNRPWTDLPAAYNLRVSVDAAVAAEALVETFRHFVSAVPGSWVRGTNVGVAGVTGVAMPTLNGVWVQQVDAEVEDISDLLKMC